MDKPQALPGEALVRLCAPGASLCALTHGQSLGSVGNMFSRKYRNVSHSERDHVKK